MKPEIRKVKIDLLRLEESCQARAELSLEAVESYAELYRGDGPPSLPPIEVFEVDGAHIVVDGFHRIAAALKAGKTFIRCKIVGSGDLEFASWTALGMNHRHGVRRTREDKRKAVWLALDGIGQDQSGRELAKHLGVSHTFVSKIREEWESAHSGDTGADGNVATPHAANDGQEATPSDSDDSPATEPPPPDTSTAEPSSLERAQALDRIAALAFKNVRQVHEQTANVSAGEFPDIEELADEVLDAAKVLAAGATAVRKVEETELHRGS